HLLENSAVCGPRGSKDTVSGGASLRRSAGGKPGGDELALLCAHTRDIARRHGARAHGVDLDQARVSAEAVGGVGRDALGRRVYTRPHGLVAMAHAAACEDRILRRLDIDAAGARADVRGAGSRQPSHGKHAGSSYAPRPPRAAFTLVPGIEEVADDRA